MHALPCIPTMLKVLAVKPATKLKVKIYGIRFQIPFSEISMFSFTICKQVKLKRAVFSAWSSDLKFSEVMHKNYMLQVFCLGGCPWIQGLHYLTCGRGFLIPAIHQKVCTTSANLYDKLSSKLHWQCLYSFPYWSVQEFKKNDSCMLDEILN